MDIFSLSQLRLEVALPVLLVIIGGILLGLYQLKGPSPVGEDAPASQFSALRALRHLRIIAHEPHPPGTPAHRLTGDYLLKTLADIGLECQVQETTTVNTLWGAPYPCGKARNILARLPGEISTPKILISAHYDSVPGSPGATDNGTAVAALLETARALKSGPTLHNDIIFLFVDGEEVGLLGSQSFVEKHPWAKEIGLVINLDARGTRGPVLMYETSQGNHRLIKEFKKAVPYPVATSFSYEVSKRLPNYTDFNIFKNTGWPGLNFALVGNLVHYHTALDNLANFDPKVLQHQGSYALGLLRHFGNLDLSHLKEINAVNSTYFNPFRASLWSYSERWTLPLTLLAVFEYAVSVQVGLANNFLNWLNLGLGFLIFLVGVAAVGAVTYCSQVLIRRLHPQYKLHKSGDTYNSRLYLLAFLFLGLAVGGSIYGWFAGNTNGFNLWAGVLLGWLIGLIVLSRFLPSAGYLVTWPLLSNLTGLIFLFVVNKLEAGPAVSLLIYAIFMLPALLLLAPIIALFFDVLGLRLAFLVMLMVEFVTGLLAPFTILLTGPANWPLTIILLVAALGCFCAGSLSGSFNERRRQPNNIFYALDADSGEAVWGSPDPSPDEWTAQFLGKEATLKPFPEYFISSRLMKLKTLQAAAPRAELPGPELEILEDTLAGEERNLHLRICSARKAPVLSLFLATGANPELLQAELNGTILTNPPGQKPVERWGLRCWPLPEEGFELRLRVKNNAPLTLTLADQSFGLPGFASFPFHPRPDHMMPPAYQGFIADSTLVKKTYRL
jgi:MFS family permease